MRMSDKVKKALVVVVIAVLVVGAGFASFVFLSRNNFFGLMSTSRDLISEKATNLNGPIYTSAPQFEISGNVQVAPGTQSSTTSQTSFGLKIMKHGTVQMQVDKGDFFDTWSKIVTLTNSYSGNIANSSYYKESEFYFGSITVVIPSERFDEFLTTLQKYGKVESLNVSTDDVTSEYVDSTAKLKVLESQRDLLESWLKSAKNVDEMIKLRDEITQVEEQIETIKGRLNYIAFHTDFSDITISLSEKEGSFNNTTFWDTVVYWLKKPVQAFLYSLIGLLVAVLFAVPWVLLGFGIYKLVEKAKAKNS